MKLTDSLGIEILPTDTVMVTAYGCGARACDVRVTSPVLGIGRKRIKIRDVDREPRSVDPRCLTVLSRRGDGGFEANATTTKEHSRG